MAQGRRGALSLCACMVGDWNRTNEAAFRHQMGLRNPHNVSVSIPPKPHLFIQRSKLRPLQNTGNKRRNNLLKTGFMFLSLHLHCHTSIYLSSAE
ncbi:hypothetical protein NC652_036099 [Populus alba x Populus x berolinensis]|nr:hypothetical protein NC652_036099 [Populus alba x Populus x berolinensis]